VFEPYRIKIVEPLIKTTKNIRRKVLQKAGYNPFLIPAKYVTIDLVSDSGTGAMSSDQLSEMIKAREDFAGQKTSEDFINIAKEITNFPYIQPVHQGRTAENILFKILLKPGDIVLSNTHFETTRGNIESLGCKAIDIPKPKPPFYGNIDIDKLAKFIKRSKRVKMVILTMTNNTNGGQPISLDNIRRKILLVFDACRIADNAFLIKDYTKSRLSIKKICQNKFRFADIVYLSSKKDGLVNIGGFIGVRDKKIYEKLAFEIIRQESFPSSGGLAARDMAAMTIGLQEALNEDFLQAHINGLRYLAKILKEHKIKIFEPVGGHGIVIKPKRKFPYAAFALAAEVYLQTSIRGGVFDNNFRLAIPRRVYTKNHLAYVGESISRIYGGKLPRLKPVNRPKNFFNFFAKFKKV
jgi:tyrosine phenol-lyase